MVGDYGFIETVVTNCDFMIWQLMWYSRIRLNIILKISLVFDFFLKMYYFGSKLEYMEVLFWGRELLGEFGVEYAFLLFFFFFFCF